MAASAWALAASTVVRAETPLTAYGQLPLFEQIAISPKGDLLAMVVTNGEQRKIAIENLTTSKIVTGLAAGAVKIRDITWAGEDHLIITKSSTTTVSGVLSDRAEWFTADDFNVARQKLTPLLGDVDFAGNMVAGLPVVRILDGKPVIFETGLRFVGDDAMRTLFRIDLTSDRSQAVMDADQDTADSYLVSADGHPLALTEYDAVTKQWNLKVWRSGTWRLAQTTTAAIETPEVEGLGRDGQTVLISQLENHETTLRELSPNSGTLSDPLPGPNDGEPIEDPVTHQLIGVVALDGDVLQYTFYKPADQAAWDAVVAAFPGRTISLVSWSDDRRKLVVHVDSPSDVPEYARGLPSRRPRGSR